VAFQEQIVANDIKRTYGALLYRQQKLQLLEETYELNERLVENVRKLIDAGKLKPVELILVQSELIVMRDQIAAGQELVTAARQDLLRTLGARESVFTVEGSLELPAWKWDRTTLTDLALDRRADLKARQMAVAEAAANTRLTVANRSGNPTVGTVFTYDPTR